MWLATTVLMLLGSVFGFGQSDEPRSDEPRATLYRELSNRLVAEALSLSADEASAARAILERAVSIDPGNPDAHHHLALNLRSDQRATREVIRRLRHALAHEQGAQERIRIASDLASLLLRTNDPAGAASLLAGEFARVAAQEPPGILLDWVAAPDTGRAAPLPLELGEPELLYIEATLAAGSPWFRSALIHRARRAFPRDATLAALDWSSVGRVRLATVEWLEAFGDQPFARESAERLRESLLVRLVDRPPDATGRAVMHHYRRLDGRDPVVDIVDHALNGVPLSDVATIALTSGDKLAWEVADRYGIALPAEVARTLSAPGFELQLDADRDGFVEERYRFESGVLVEWLSDADQDGITDLTIWREAGMTHLVQRVGEIVSWVVFAPAPAVVEVRRLRLTARDGEIPLRQREPVVAIASRRWRAANPVPLELPFDWPRAVDQDDWSALAERVRVQHDVSEIFTRQLASDDAVGMSVALGSELEATLRVRGVIE